MKPGWNVLLVEDSLADSLLIERELKRSGRSGVCRRVDTLVGISEAAATSSWDVVLCDYNLPQFSFFELISHIQQCLPGVPLLLISGSIDLDKAINLLKLGIADFVLKDSLARLVPSIERCLEEAATQAARRTAESELVESRRFAQASLDALSAHIAVLDGEGTILAVNQAWRDFATENEGVAVRVAEGANYLAVCDNDGHDGKSIAGMIRGLMAGEQQEYLHEYPCQSPGEARWFLCRVTRVDDGGVLRVVTAHENITARKEAELALVKREEDLLRQRNALIALTVGSMPNRDDLLSMIRHITEAATNTLDVGRASVWCLNSTGTSIQCIDLYDATSDHHSGGAELSAVDYPIYFTAILESRIIAADDARAHRITREFSGGYFQDHGITSMLDAPIHVRGKLYGVVCHEHVGPVRIWTSDEKSFAMALAGLVSLALEENERRQADERLRLHSAALKATNNGIVIADREGTITWVNPAFSALTGYTFEDAVGRDPRELVNSGCHTKEFFDEMWTTILSGQIWHGNIVNRRKDGSLYHEAQSIAPIFNAAAQITHFVAVKEDVSERLRVEATLQEARERLLRAVTAGRIGLWEWEPETGTANFSAEWVTQAGLPAVAENGTLESWFQRVHPDDEGPLRQTLRDCADHPQTRFQREFRLRNADGEWRWILLSASGQNGETGQALRVTGTNIDITDRKLLEQEFQQAQKMESIGRLAGGVAHDFNNLLGVIIGYAELSITSLEEGHPLYENVVQIQRAADRAASLTRQLLAFSRRQVLRPQVIDIDTVVVEMEKMLRRLIGEDIKLVVERTGILGHVMADPGQIEQILMNLAVNARDAMPGGGCLTIATRNEMLDEEQARRRPGAHAGHYVSIIVRDTGFGMDRRTQDKIFEPFFTSKEVGRGTGLGLATVYGIVKQSGGSIWVSSEPGHGAEFTILLPRIDAPLDSDHHATLPSGLVSGTETILLAEDEESLRAVTAVFLTRMGYNVLTAVNGTHAIQLMLQHPTAVNLLLTDVIMPGMSGPEMVMELRLKYPLLKVLYMSGYAEDTIVHHGVLDENVEFVNKPFTFTQLTQKIRSVLDSEQTAP